MNILQFIIKPIFQIVWRKYLKGYKLIKVTGWKSCLMDSRCGQRIRATFVLDKVPTTYMDDVA